jgi:hypothetical protein
MNEILQIKNEHLRLAPNLFPRLIKNLEVTDSGEKLSDREVEEKCFQVLGFLEEYYRIPSLDSKVKQVFNPDESGSLELQLDEIINGTNQTRTTLLETDLESIDDSELYQPEGNQELNDYQKKTKKLNLLNSRQHREEIKAELAKLLLYPQVMERFQDEFNQEISLYKTARKPMKKVRNINRMLKKLKQAIYKSYLSGKKEHGKLTQSAANKITFFQNKFDELELQKKGVEDIASPTTKGYLETQKLLEYKRQLNENGFIMTPSRLNLLERIKQGVLSGKKIFLVGSTGTGKSQLSFAVANELTGGYELIPWHEGSTPRDVHGYPKISIDPDTEQSYSHTEPGPAQRAKDLEKTLIHAEVTGAPTRVLLELKDTLFQDDTIFQIFTGNPKDDRTKQREEMDPAILRELTGIEVSYMPASEMFDIIKAMLIEENGVLKFSSSELNFIDQLCKAAEMMQKIHNRDFDGFSDEMKTMLGIDLQGNTETTLNNNFLDPGTLFKLFSEWELALARGKDFASYMQDKLNEFIKDPKTMSNLEERRVLEKILYFYMGSKGSSVDLKQWSGSLEVEIEKNVKNYVLPSEMLGRTALSNENPMGVDDTEKKDLHLELQKEERKEWTRVLGVKLDIPSLPDYVTPEIQENLKDMGMELRFIPSLDLGNIDDLKLHDTEEYLKGLELKYPNWNRFEKIIDDNSQKNDHSVFRNLSKMFWDWVKKGQTKFPQLPGAWVAVETLEKPNTGISYNETAVSKIFDFGTRIGVSWNNAQLCIENHKIEFLQKINLPESLSDQVRMLEPIEWNLLANREGWGGSSSFELTNDQVIYDAYRTNNHQEQDVYKYTATIIVGARYHGGAAIALYHNPDMGMKSIGFRVAIVLGT